MRVTMEGEIETGRGKRPSGGKQFEQAQKPKLRLRNIADSGYPAKLLGRRCEEFTNYVVGQRIVELWIDKEGGSRFFQRSP